MYFVIFWNINNVFGHSLLKTKVLYSAMPKDNKKEGKWKISF